MKTTRKILPALAMLLVSAIMLSTASYAWFASNSRVTAGDMHVKVRANTKFLEISETVDGTYTSAVTYVDPATEEIALINAKFNTSGTGEKVLWYLGYSSDRADKGTTNADAMTDLSKLDSDYTLQKQVFVKMSNSSDTPMTNLTIDIGATDGTKITTQSTDTTQAMKPALRILVVAEKYVAGETPVVTFEGAQIYDPGDGAGATLTSYGDTGYLVKDVELDQVYRLSIYLYFDGEDAVSFTNNAGDLTDYAINVAFSAT